MFNSWLFVAFFAVFLIVYWSAARRVSAQNFIILAGSYIFYGAWDTRFLLLLACCTVTDFVAGWSISGSRLGRRHVIHIATFLAVVAAAAVIATAGAALTYLPFVAAFVVVGAAFVVFADRLSEDRRRFAYLVGSIVYNMGVLSFFKYFNFFADSLVDLVGLFGGELGYVTMHVILPVGISFFTFQSLSFAIDSYRGKVKPTDDLVKFGAYVAFFPQLVAGPIERAAHLMPQFDRTRRLDADDMREAAVLFAWGLFKKLVIADNVAVIADTVFNAPHEASPGEIAAGILAFTLQIYCDFSGYSDMARAIARLLGFELMLNFNLPYFSRTPSEFWTRWHISLSSWLRDYLYIGLGGNRRGELATYRNLMATMVLGGLWHGASWTFVVWGAFHGAILIVYRLLKIEQRLAAPAGPLAFGARQVAAWAVMMVLVMIGWVFFRARTMGAVGDIGHGLVAAGSWATVYWHEIALLAWPLLVVEALQRFVYRRPEFFFAVPPFARLNLALLVGCALLFLSAGGGQRFIYFDF